MNNEIYDISNVWKYFPRYKPPQQSILWESSKKSTLIFTQSALNY